MLSSLSGATVLVLDNATVHRSKLVQDKRKEWKQKGLRLLFLPPYCPHLNLIEILWRQAKYRWLDCDAYQNFETLCRSVTAILAQVGTKYQLSFAWLPRSGSLSWLQTTARLDLSPIQRL